MQTITLQTKRELAPGLFELCFTRPDGWSFKAGQFARLGLECEGGEPVFRAYSIASAPEYEGLRFLIKTVRGGRLSPRLNALEIGEEAILDGVADGALLPSRIPGGSTVWMLATGSGLAPFLSMLESPASLKDWGKHVVAVCAKTVKEAQALASLAKKYGGDNLTVISTVTREDAPLQGRIPALLENGSLEKEAGSLITLEESRVLLCGNPGFTKETRAILKAKGLVSPRFGKPGQVLVEALW